MVIRGRAPLRVSFGCGGTDVEPFCVEQGGAIIGSTINKYAYCSIIPRDDDQITVHSLDFDMTVKYNAKENYVCDGRLILSRQRCGRWISSRDARFIYSVMLRLVRDLEPPRPSW